MIDYWDGTGRGSRVFWYVTSERDGRPGIAKPDGTIIWSSLKDFREDPEKSEQQKTAYIRERMFMKEYGIWDATAFACTMSCPMVLMKNGKCYVFATASHAEYTVYPLLSDEQIEQCRENVDKFYNDPNLQAGWPSLILFPVTLKITDDRKLEPVYIGEIGNSESVLTDEASAPLEMILDGEEYGEIRF